MFEWHHLPMPGGLWAQDPDWLQSVRVINQVIAKVEQAKDKAEQSKNNRGMRPPR